jgi:hypothetical protein
MSIALNANNDGTGSVQLGGSDVIQFSTSQVASFVNPVSALNVSGGLTVSTGNVSISSGSITMAAGTTTIPPLKFTTGSLLTSPVAGTVEYDGSTWFSTDDVTDGRGFIPSVHFFRLTSDITAFGPTIANYFGSTSGIALDAGIFYEIEAYKKFSKDFWLGEEEKDHETNHSADLYAIWYEKKEFVKKAIVMNPFFTNKFVWCDAGICRSESWISHIQYFPLSCKIPEDKFLLLKITDFENEEDLKFKNSVGGGILAGTKEKWFEFSEQYDSVLQEFVENSKFVGKDQTLIATMYKKNPAFFKLIDRQFDEYMCWFTLLFFLSS